MTAKAKVSDEVIFTKLVQLAQGDVGLVSEAIRSLKRDDQPVDLTQIVDYITARMRERERARARERMTQPHERAHA